MEKALLSVLWKIFLKSEREAPSRLTTSEGIQIEVRPKESVPNKPGGCLRGSVRVGSRHSPADHALGLYGRRHHRSVLLCKHKINNRSFFMRAY